MDSQLLEGIWRELAQRRGMQIHNGMTLRPTALVTLSGICIALAACSSVQSRPVSSVQYQETDRRWVEIYPRPPQRPFTVVAKLAVSTRGMRSEDKAEEKLLREAARYGADAVIIDERADEPSFHGIHARAIRWTGPDPDAIVNW